MANYQDITITKINNGFYGCCIEWNNGDYDSWEQKAKSLNEVKQFICKYYGFPKKSIKDMCFMTIKEAKTSLN